MKLFDGKMPNAPNAILAFRRGMNIFKFADSEKNSESNGGCAKTPHIRQALRDWIWAPLGNSQDGPANIS
jgi:hypothetical protein